MSGFVSRLKNWVTGEDLEEDVYSIDEELEPMRGRYQTYDIQGDDEEMERPSQRRSKKLKVVDHPNTQSAEVLVIEPRTFDEALEIVDHLRARKSVILNLHLLDNAQSQRIVDFLSGATHALDGNQQRIGDGVFIFTPNNVEITADHERQVDFTTEALWTQNPLKQY